MLIDALEAVLINSPSNLRVGVTGRLNTLWVVVLISQHTVLLVSNYSANSAPR